MEPKDGKKTVVITASIRPEQRELLDAYQAKHRLVNFSEVVRRILDEWADRNAEE